MLSIFNKKFYLKDLLEGSLDIHNHILPGIDDGAASVKDSLELIDQYGKLGVNHLIATPHIMNDYYPNTPATVSKALEEVHAALKEAGKTHVKIKAAAEYMMDHSFIELLENDEILCLHQNYVLVEMSYFQAPINLNEILFKLQTRKYRPVLAHPERYAYFHSKKLKKYKELKDRGCHFQLNILSLIGHYGSNIQAAAVDLLENNMIDFIGTDTHQIRHLEKLCAAKISKKQYNQLKLVFQRTKNTLMPTFSS